MHIRGETMNPNKCFCFKHKHIEQVKQGVICTDHFGFHRVPYFCSFN